LVAEYSHDVQTQLTAPRVLVDSAHVTWPGPVSGPPANHYIVEAPSIVHWGVTDQYYLSFSGDACCGSTSDNYATGMASCGKILTTGGECRLQAGPSKSFWGRSGRGHGGTLKTVPGDLKGPGGMSFVTLATGGFAGADDHAYVAMHYNNYDDFLGLIRPMVDFEMFRVGTSPSLSKF
jgi:hypothetical protein